MLELTTELAIFLRWRWYILRLRPHASYYWSRF